MSNHQDPEELIKNFENFDWSQLSLERIKKLQSTLSKAIALKIQEKLTKDRDRANLGKIYEYKARLAKVFPQSMRTSLSKHEKCVFAISLGSKNFVYQERIEACIKWISDNFKNCLGLCW